MTEPNWLDDDEQRTWRSLVQMLLRVDTALDRQLIRDAGMTHPYYMILVMLSEAPGRTLRMGNLAEVNGYSLSRLSHAVARLEEKGWVRRTRCASDKRGNFAELTDAGYAALVAAAPGHVDEVRRRVFDPLTRDDVEKLGHICDKVLATLAAD